MLDIYAPIIPYEGLGGLRLYSTIEELLPVLNGLEITVDKSYYNWIRYDIKDTVSLFFHNKNRKLWKLSALDNYKGKLFGKIGIGTTEEQLVALEPSFAFDEFEEVFESPKGIFIESYADNLQIFSISVYIKELNDPDFEEARW